jgi:FkbM family methyltransferase
MPLGSDMLMKILEVCRRLTYDQFALILISFKIHYKPVSDIFKIYRLKRDIALIKGPDDCWLLVPRQGGPYTYSLIGEGCSFKLFKELVKPSMTFLDVGAGVGSYSIPAAKRGLKVIAIERDPISFQLLLENAKLNDVKLEMFNIAAYDRKCKLIIQPYVSLRRERFKIVVEAMPIDDLGITPDVVKIDVDGAEIHVLRGSLNTLRKARWIFIELRPSTLKEALRIFKGLNKRGNFVEHLYTSGIGLLIRPRVKPSDFMLLFS